jgi:hypothetical protein
MAIFRRDQVKTEISVANVGGKRETAPLKAIVPPDKSDGRRRLRFEEAVGGSSG